MTPYFKPEKEESKRRRARYVYDMKIKDGMTSDNALDFVAQLFGKRYANTIKKQLH